MREVGEVGDEERDPAGISEEVGKGEPPAQELRVHGVGGAHGARMLGFESPTEVVVAGEGVAGTSVLARRQDPSVESYDWGDLTSSSGTRALWIVLLPFTLLNIAGWMHAPAHRTSQNRVRWTRRLVHLLSVLLTATYVFSFGIVVVDLVGWQWSRRLALPEDESAYVAAAMLPSTLWWQRAGAAIGLVALLLVVVGVMWLAGKSQARFEKRKPSPEVRTDLSGGEPWGDDERLGGSGFFYHPGAASRRLRLHRVVLAVTYLGVAGWSMYHAFVPATPPERLEVGRLLGPCSVAAVVVILALYAVSWRNGRRQGESWVRCGPAVAATLSFALVNAVFSGAILLLLKRLNDWPKRPEPAPRLVAGPEVNLVDVWGFLILVVGVAAAGLWVMAAARRPVTDIADRDAPPGRPLDGADEGYRKSIAKSCFLAQVARRGGALALAVAATLIVTEVVVLLYRVFFSFRDHGSVYLQAPESLDSPLYRVGAYVLPLLALVLVQLVRRGVGGARTLASTLWDVLTFWPRRFSPLAVRPYAERAVPELQGRVLHHVDQAHWLVLSAHSQGSILAFAALAPLPADDLGRVALVTYGSPISTVYATFFPAYFGIEEVEALRTKLASPGPGLLGWRNFYRKTDPIGGPVFAATSGTVPEPDCELQDPFPGPASSFDTATTPPLEHDRPPWSQLAVHSFYLQEPMLKRWVRDLRAALSQRPPG